MKESLFKHGQNPGARWLFLFTLLSLFGGADPVRATDALSSWSGSVTVAPQIDATNFYNSGIWNIIAEPKPFQTANTLNYTNTGTMNSTVGWEFDLGPNNSGSPASRRWSSKFFNDSLGTVSATSGFGNPFTQLVPVGYLLISATNIVNKGVLSADPLSELYLNGLSVDIHRSAVEIVPAVGAGSPNDFVLSDFTTDTGIYDQYWGQGITTNLPTRVIWNGTTASSWLFKESGICAVVNATGQLGPSSPVVSDSTNFVVGYIAAPGLSVTNLDGSTTNRTDLPTNIVRQAVFVFLSDTNISSQIRFSPSPTPTNNFNTVAVQISTPYTNFATLAVQSNAVYLVDTLASVGVSTLFPDLFLNPYAECNDATYRPANYTLSRVEPAEFAFGVPGTGTPTNNYFYQPDFTNSVIFNSRYSTYSAYVDNQAIQLAPFYSVTNEPGRIHINADSLNLSLARLRGEGEIVLQATNLISSAGAVLDCENLSFNLGSTNGFLNLTNLVLPSVSRFHGPISVWSATWINQEQQIITNYTVSTNGPAVLTPLTNFVAVQLNVVVVDASGLSSFAPVVVQDLILHSTNMVVSDSTSVTNSLLFDGLSLTLNGGLNIYGSLIPNWNTTIAPTLRYFTNNNILFINNDAHFGDDGPTNYLTFVNHGLIFSADQFINADNLQIVKGTNETIAGNFSALTQTGQLAGSIVYSSGDIQLTANSLQINQSTLSAFGALDFNVTGSLSDLRFGSSNLFYCENGFNLSTKPATGDLLGTTLTTIAAFGGAEVAHTWAGVDRGVSVAGFTNNVAIGSLILSPQGNTNFFEPLWDFYGTTGGNGLYVSNLDLSLLTDIANEIYINPSLTIYFVTAELNPVVNTGALTAEQFLDGQFGGHLRWVQGVTSLIKKQPAAVSRFQLSSSFSAATGKLQLTGTIMPAQTNVIQASTDLINWVSIYTNIGSYSNIGPSTIVDPNAGKYGSRFYRAVPWP